MTLTQFVSKLAEDPTKLAPLLVSVAAFAFSIISLVLNRRHATRLFEAREYPDIKLTSVGIYVASQQLEDILRNGERRLGYSGQRNVDHRPSLQIRYENATAVPARDFFVCAHLRRRLSRVRVKLDHRKWKVIAPHADDGVEFADVLNKALTRVYPAFIRRDLGKGSQAEYRWLELPNGRSAPDVGVLIEYGWRPPLAGAPVEKRYLTGVMRPRLLAQKLEPEKGTSFEQNSYAPVTLTGQPVVDWEFSPEPATWFARLTSWRPVTSEIVSEEQ